MPQQPLHIPPSSPFVELATVDSTNNYALGLVHAGLAQHGTCIFTHEQTAGKGQRARSWQAQKGQNVLMSVLLAPATLSIAQQPQLSVCCAVAAFRFFSRYAGEATCIKWPNDLYWHDRKAGGILIENVIGTGSSSQWKWAVAGIGININQVSFPGHDRKAVSLKQITGKEHDIASLVKELYACLVQEYARLENGDFPGLLADYNRHLYKRGEKVRLKKGTRVFEALIRGVAASGQLVTWHGLEETFELGEIEWLIH